MDKVKVLVVDDSAIYRTQIKAALAMIPQVEVVGSAGNGRLAIEQLAKTPADLLILDLEMPEMDGMQTLAELNRLRSRIKVLLFASSTKRSAECTLESLRQGASDFITKPGPSAPGDAGSPSEKIRALIEPKIRALFTKSFVDVSKAAAKPASTATSSAYPRILWELFRPKVLVIGSSTGGPPVLDSIFSQISGPLNCPILIAQHMPPIFTATLAERLAKITGIEAKEAVNGEPLLNRIYVAPGDYHMTIGGSAANPIVYLDKGPQENFVRPAVDPLFRSATQIYKDKCLGIILTGMGADGKDGAIHIKQSGGAMIIQDKDSCVVFGMPGAVHDAGAFDKMCTPQEIVQIIKDKVVSNRISTSVNGKVPGKL